LEGISEQIEQARISEDGCESENDSSSSSKALVAGIHAFVSLKRVNFISLTLA